MLGTAGGARPSSTEAFAESLFTAVDLERDLDDMCSTLKRGGLKGGHADATDATDSVSDSSGGSGNGATRETA